MERKKLEALVKDGEPKILNIYEKDGGLRYIVNNELELHKVCQYTIKYRFESDRFYGYSDPIRPSNKTGFDSIEEINALPDGSIKMGAEVLWKRFEIAMADYENALNFYIAIKESMKYVFDPKDKHFVRNKAYFILIHRSGGAYDTTDLERPCKIPA
jgi:hypothetical protein